MSHRRQSFSCIKFAASAVRAHWQRSMNRLQRPLPVTSQQSVPLAVANSDVATAERLFRAIVELVVGPAMIGTVIACLCDIEAAMVAKPSRQEPGLLPVDMDQKTICGCIAS